MTADTGTWVRERVIARSAAALIPYSRIQQSTFRLQACDSPAVTPVPVGKSGVVAAR
ncbi:MAG TPA: hypothetical protein VF070_07535 [Streptosporangiaceae bacterium]